MKAVKTSALFFNLLAQKPGWEKEVLPGQLILLSWPSFPVPGVYGRCLRRSLEAGSWRSGSFSLLLILLNLLLFLLCHPLLSPSPYLAHFSSVFCLILFILLLCHYFLPLQVTFINNLERMVMLEVRKQDRENVISLLQNIGNEVGDGDGDAELEKGFFFVNPENLVIRICRKKNPCIHQDNIEIAKKNCVNHIFQQNKDSSSFYRCYLILP